MSEVFRSKTVRGVLAFAAAAIPLGIATLMPQPADAQRYSKRVESACKGDYDRHCPHYKARTPALHSCMQLAGRRGNLSPRCFNALVDAGMVPKKYLKKR